MGFSLIRVLMSCSTVPLSPHFPRDLLSSLSSVNACSVEGQGLSESRDLSPSQASVSSSVKWEDVFPRARFGVGNWEFSRLLESSEAGGKERASGR